MPQGLYRVEFETPRRKVVGVILAENGKAFAYIGSYQPVGATRGLIHQSSA
jgi:hypothetical protein